MGLGHVTVPSGGELSREIDQRFYNNICRQKMTRHGCDADEVPVQAQGAEPYNGAVRGSECGGLAGIPGRPLAHRGLHLPGRAYSGEAEIILESFPMNVRPFINLQTLNLPLHSLWQASL